MNDYIITAFDKTRNKAAMTQETRESMRKIKKYVRRNRFWNDHLKYPDTFSVYVFDRKKGRIVYAFR